MATWGTCTFSLEIKGLLLLAQATFRTNRHARRLDRGEAVKSSRARSTATGWTPAKPRHDDEMQVVANALSLLNIVMTWNTPMI